MAIYLFKCFNCGYRREEEIRTTFMKEDNPCEMCGFQFRVGKVNNRRYQLLWKRRRKKGMYEVSENFRRHEFACKCGCGFEVCDKEILDRLEQVRAHFNEVCAGDVYIEITSGNRCRKHNRIVGGAKKSRHLGGIAVDFKVFEKFTTSKGIKREMINPDRVYEYINVNFPDRYGLIIYSSWIHLDMRTIKYRGDER